MTRRLRPLIVTAAVLLLARPALAGPPLLCFPYEIGDATSLPMGTGGWQAVDRRYDISHLVPDTLALLTPETPIITRMETLRRATVYASKSATVASALLDTLQARASRPSPDVALAVFDFGYLVETYKQANFLTGSQIKSAQHIDGYSLVQKALALNGNPAMEFALLVMAVDKSHGVDELRTRAAAATAAARTDLSVKLNLTTHFADTVAQLR
jgi:hypothetical protein